MTSFNDWEQQEMARLKAQYGTVPPPWVLLPDHPYDPSWYSGRGADLVTLWQKWWHEQHWWQAQQFQYLHRFEPPAAWLEWVIFALWPDAEAGFTSLNTADETAQHEYLKPYFHRLKALNLGNYQDWSKAVAGHKRSSTVSR